MQPSRLLDVIIPSYNRPARLFKLLETGLELNIKDMYMVVIDDCSTIAESVKELGSLTTKQVCEHFQSPNIVYIRNNENIGLARSWVAYYKHHCDAKYTMSIVDKDYFINPQPIENALAKLESDAAICMVVIPMYQQHAGEDFVLETFNYPQISGKEFISRFINDVSLQHCSSYGIKRVSCLQQAGIPNNLQLKQYGLEDGFGIDIDLILRLATTGNVDFETEPHVKVVKVGGGTEQYPLTFAYTYYQYVKQVLQYLLDNGYISQSDACIYIKMWLQLILRGLYVAYNPVHGTEKERGTTRISKHLSKSIHKYLLQEAYKNRIIPNKEMLELYLKTIGFTLREKLLAYEYV